jgi:hypothetical protein
MPNLVARLRAMVVIVPFRNEREDLAISIHSLQFPNWNRVLQRNDSSGFRRIGQFFSLCTPIPSWDWNYFRTRGDCFSCHVDSAFFVQRLSNVFSPANQDVVKGLAIF